MGRCLLLTGLLVVALAGGSAQGAPKPKTFHRTPVHHSAAVAEAPLRLPH